MGGWLTWLCVRVSWIDEVFQIKVVFLYGLGFCG